jgi:RHS repeat-associated protein
VYLYADVQGRTPFAFIDYDNVDAEPGSGQRRYVFSNQISCPVRVEDESGAVLWRAECDAYGRATIQPDSAIELNLRWPGHYFDPETGLQYNRHRYYSPVLGRYIQVDPRDLDGGINVYAYPARPLDLVDVDGLAPCKKKPMVEADEDDPAFLAAKKKADKIANDLIEALEASKMHPLAMAGRTLTTMVVLGTDGKYHVVVTGNGSKRGLPRSVKEAMGGARYIGYGDDAPPPVRQEDKGLRNPRDNPRTGEREPTTHKHAEQRGLRATDCDDNTKGVAYISPTRPCCEGCSKAIQKRGGTSDNVSDLGTQPGDHGDWWKNK